jgi:hypothetical protein
MRFDWRSARRPSVVEVTKNVRVDWAASGILTRTEAWEWQDKAFHAGLKTALPGLQSGERGNPNARAAGL